MSLIRKFKSFAAMPAATKWLFAEAVFTSAYVKLTLSFLPFKKVAGWLGKHHVKDENIYPQELPMIKKLRSIILLCNKYTPWPTECYTQALTAKIMLRRRKIKSTLYLGFRKNETLELEGHAWLQSSGIVVTGFKEFSKFTIHSYFT